MVLGCHVFVFWGSYSCLSVSTVLGIIRVVRFRKRGSFCLLFRPVVRSFVGLRSVVLCCVVL